MSTTEPVRRPVRGPGPGMKPPMGQELLSHLKEKHFT